MLMFCFQAVRPDLELSYTSDTDTDDNNRHWTSALFNFELIKKARISTPFYKLFLLKNKKTNHQQFTVALYKSTNQLFHYSIRSPPRKLALSLPLGFQCMFLLLGELFWSLPFSISFFTLITIHFLSFLFPLEAGSVQKWLLLCTHRQGQTHSITHHSGSNFSSH